MHAGAAESTSTPHSMPNDHEGTSNVNDTEQATEDLAILEQLNKDFFHSDQFSDAKRFSEFLGEDFISQFPGLPPSRGEFPDYIARPPPFKDLAMHDVTSASSVTLL